MSENNQPRDAGNWAQKQDALRVDAPPPEAMNINVHGRQVVGPLQGFGQLWQKTYHVRLENASATPAEVIAAWKQHFPEFQPPTNRFFPSVAGVAPGEVVLINASLQGMPISTGVMVLYADDTSFTLMTPQGHPESGWVTFSAREEDGSTVAEVQSMARANDPIYELGFAMGGSAAQEQIWHHVLRSLATHFGMSDATVVFAKQCVDPRLQWHQARNVWHNAAIRSVLYTITKPLRRTRG